MTTKEEIKSLLKENLKGGKPLNVILLILKEHLKRDLDMMEDYYVKYKCLKYCLDAWVEQCTKQLQALDDVEYLSEILEDINALTVKALVPKQFPRELRLLTRNNSFKFLEDFCSNFISLESRHERLIILETFKAKIWNNVLENVEQYRDSKEYLEQFQLLLTESGISKYDLIAGLKLQTLSTPLDNDDLSIIKTCLGKMKQKYVEPAPQKIISRLISLHENRLEVSSDSEKVIVKNKLALRMEYFVRPANISATNGVLTICGCVLSISEVYSEIVKQLKKCYVQEVHIYSPDVIIVDRDLQDDEFKGVNFVVSTTKLIISSSHVWDFSGENGQSAFSMNPPKAINPLQNGLDGEDGKPGKPGGNVQIIISSVIGQGIDASLHIRSNGGDGGSGQVGGDGGHGIDGEDGDKYTSIDEDKFRSMIPKVSRFNDKMSNRHQLKCYQALIDILEAEGGYQNENSCLYHASGEKFVYQSIVTSAGAEAGFSIYEGPLHTKAYGFHAWYFASAGTEGSLGGYPGRGGKGGSPGYAGEIDIQLNSSNSGSKGGKSPRNSGQLSLITVEKSDGNAGKDAPPGKEGIPGRPGRKGTDYACVHPFRTIHGRTFYKGTLIKRLHESKIEPSPYCGFAKSKIHFENSIREFTRLKNENKRFELKARAPIKTAQKQRSIVKADIQREFETHCRKYFLETELHPLMTPATSTFFGRLSHQVFESSSMHSALQTLQIASRIRDFNPKDPVPPPRKKILVGESDRIKNTDKLTRENSKTRLNRKSLLTPIEQSPLLDLTQSLLLYTQSLDAVTNLNNQHVNLKHNIQELCRRIQEVVHSSGSETTGLSMEGCKRLLLFIKRHDDNMETNMDSIPLILDIKTNLIQTLRHQLLYKLHCQIQLLPEVSMGKIRKLDPNFFLIFIKNCGQLLENNFQSSNLHVQLGQDIERYLVNEADQLNGEHNGSSPSHFFNVLKTSIFEKGVTTNFPTFMEYLNRYTKKHVKKLSKNNYGTVLANGDDNDSGDVVPNVLVEYAKVLSKGLLSDLDFDVLATIYRVQLCVYNKNTHMGNNCPNPSPNSVSPRLHLRYSAQPLTNSFSSLLNNELAQSQATTCIKIIETDVNFAPLAKFQVISNQQAQIYLEILNDTSRSEFFEEFDLAERQQAIEGCFLNRRFTLSKLFTPPSSSTDLDTLTQKLNHILPDTSRIIKLAFLTSTRFDNRLIQALIDRLTWQGDILLSNRSTFVELVLAILGSDEVDMLHIEWTITALPQKDWILEIVFIILQQIFRSCNQTVHQFQWTQWKHNLSRLEETGLILIAEKSADYFHERISATLDEITYPNVQLINTIENISSIISENIDLTTDDIYNELLDIRLQDWPKVLTNIKIRKTFQLLNTAWKGDESNQDYKKCIYYVSFLYNEHPNFIDECICVLHKIKTSHPKTEIDTGRLLEIFSNYYHGYWSISSIECETNFQQLDSFEYFYVILAHQNDSKIPKGVRQRDDILKFLSSDKNTTLSQMDIQKLRFILKEEPKSGVGFLDPEVPIKEAISKWALKIRTLAPKEKPSVGEMLYCINSAISHCKNFTLRDTQKVTLVTMLQEERRNTLAQVSTGEGKSIIVVAWAIMRVLLGGRCDVVTSSSVLAERDANDNKDVFEIFHVTVGHNSSCDVEARKSAYKNDVVYGDVGNFQRDYLLNKYFETNILGERSALENLSIMVDEVDSMLLDKGSSVLYLSHKPAGMEALNPIFIFIWKTMNINSKPEVPVTFNLVKQAVLSEIRTVITPATFQCLEEGKNNAGIAAQIHSALCELGLLDLNNCYTPKQISRQPSLPDHLSSYETQAWYLIKVEDARKREFVVPQHLEEFVDLHLDSWISSAFRALELTTGNEYIVDTTSKSFICPDKDPKVIIVDRDTGVDLFQSQWNDALHQFLQLKHQTSFSNLNLKAIFISNRSYFRRYGLIHGLTGTLGSEIERNFLKKNYAVEFINIPTATPKKFVEELPIVVGSLEEWRDSIVSKAIELASSEQKKRSALIICESINDADYLQLGLVDKVQKMNSTITLENIHVYKRSYEKFSILMGNDKDAKADKELCPGHIIISTNLAGRGTDIKISQELNNNGGLCVILSYLPNNIRVEQQAFGRAARKGQNGSGILIIRNKSLLQNHSSHQRLNDTNNSNEVTMVDLKNDRDEYEVLAMSQIESEFESIIGYEESLFQHFSKHYQRMKPRIKEFYNKTAIQDVVLHSLIDKWAFWLDKIVTLRVPYAEAIKSLNNLMRDFQQPRDDVIVDYLDIGDIPTALMTQQSIEPQDADEQIMESETLSPSNLIDILDSPTHLVTVGKLYLDKSTWSRILGTVWNDNTYAEIAIPFFDKAISIMGSNSPLTTIPLYYKAYAMIIMKDKIDSNTRAEVKTMLRTVERGFQTLIAQECSHISAVLSISLRLHETQSFVQVESFKEQRKNMIALYQLFIDSIHGILGSILLPTYLQTQSITTHDQISELLTQLTEARLIRNCSVIELPPCNNSAVPNGVTNRLVYKCLDPDVELLEEIAAAYGVRSVELHELGLSLREECETRMDITNEEIKQFFEHRLRLPTKNEFWEALVSSRVVSSLTTVGVICGSLERLVEDPCFKRLQKNGKVGDIFQIERQGRLFYKSFVPNIAISSSSSRHLAVIIRDSYSDAVRNLDFRSLETKGFIQLNQFGEWMSENIDQLGRELEYGPGYLLKFEYALKVLAERGVPLDFLDYNLEYHLIGQNLITPQGLLVHADFDSVNWGKYAFFKDQIVAVFKLHCIYRIYTLHLDKEMKTEQQQPSSSVVNLSFINSDPCSSLVNELFYSGVLRRYRILKPSESLSEPLLGAQFKALLEKFETLTIDEVKKFFKRVNILTLGSVEAFWLHLISKSWLNVTEIGYEDEIPQSGKINIPKHFTGEYLEHPWNTPEIINFLIVRGALVHEKYSILHSLEQFTSRLSLISKPDGSLASIDSKLNKSAKQRMSSEISVIQSMGLDSLINVFDKSWSPLKIEKAASNCSSGYLQIAAGIAISVYSVGFGAFSGQTLIDQGISDMCFFLMNMFSDHLNWEGYWTAQLSSSISSLVALISPAVSGYLMGTCPPRYGSSIISQSAANGQSECLRVASSAGLLLGQEVVKVILSEISFTAEVFTIGEKIKSKYDELLQDINTHLSKLVDECMASEQVIQLCQRTGNDEARSKLILTLSQDNNFSYEEWSRIESLIQTYADHKLSLVRNWVFEKKNITSKYHFYLKQIDKLSRISSKDIAQSEDLVQDIGREISSILKTCIASANNSAATTSTSIRNSSSIDTKYQNKFISFEICKILYERVEEILYDILLAPISNTVTSNFLVDADASLIRQLSQSRRNLVKSFTIQQHLSRLFMPKNTELVSPKGHTQPTESVGYDLIQELRLKRLSRKMINMERKCTDPYLLSEFVLAELSSGQVLLQACANFYNCKIILKEMDGSCCLKKIEVIPANPRMGEDQRMLFIELPALSPTLSITEPLLSSLTAAQLLDRIKLSQRKLLDALLKNLLKSEAVQHDFTRDKLRCQLAEVIKSDVAILITLRNRRMNMK